MEIKMANLRATRGLAAALIAGLALLWSGGRLMAQGTDQQLLQQMQQQIQQMQQRLAEQEAANAQLQKQINELKQVQAEAATAPAPKMEAQTPTVKTGGGEMLTIKGFIDATFFAQDQNFAFGNGQNAEWPEPPEYEHNRWFSGGDLRNTRLTLVFNGPKLHNGWAINSVIEGDFFGGYNGTGAFSNEQATPRLRLAYVGLTKGGTTIRFGQDWSPLFANVPVSLSHVAFPLGYGSAGGVGWRFPGVYVFQDLTGKSSPVKIQFQGGIFQGSWSGPGNNLSWQSAGGVGFRPQYEARFNFSGKMGNDGKWLAYVVGHYDTKDLAGVNGFNAGTGPKHGKLDGKAYEAGFKFDVAKFMVQGNAYYGRAIGQQFGNLTQFGDIAGWGGWMQVGYNFTQHWSAYAFYGSDNPKDADVRDWIATGGRLKNYQTNLMVRYKTGPFALGLEWLHAELDSYSTLTSPVVTTSGNQIALSAMYSF